MTHNRHISVTGLGYVGLPVAVAFARRGRPVIGFDIDADRIEQLRNGHDRTGEVDAETLLKVPMTLTADPEVLVDADFHIIAAPTPVSASRRPDLTPLVNAAATVGRRLKPGDIVVFESTVYPGATESACIPVLERESGLRCGQDFAVGYSPERINPGDRVHRFETITKVVSATDPHTLDIMAAVYGDVVEAGIHRAPSIAAAEAAKVIENTQRDLNIALMNELAKICAKLDIRTTDVLDAARTKWNFLPFTPGLVGGHCVGVDPYYLTYRCEQVGYHPEVILAGRRINDGMPAWIAQETVKRLLRMDPKPETEPRSLIVLGVTFKENVPDTRNSRAIDLVRELHTFGLSVRAHDPFAQGTVHEEGHTIDMTSWEDLEPADAVVLAVPHADYLQGGWPLIQGLLRHGRGLVVDVRAHLDASSTPSGITIWQV
jgi:UDP-N-acetyl-D-galactosamine dehydrogenase